jgi:plastocyanin
LLFASTLLGVIAGCSSNTTGTSTSNSPPPTPTPADITIVQGASMMTTGAFSPDTKTVSLSGGTSVSVRWVNEDISGSGYGGSTAVTHHIVSDDGKSFDTGDLGGNQTSTKALSAAGTYTYHCAIHPNMVGSVVVNP